MKKLIMITIAMIASFSFLTTSKAAVVKETLKEACEAEGLTCDFTEKDTSSLPNIYVFRGKGCTYCKKLLSHLASIYETSSNKVNIVVYEVAKNSDNYALYEKVAAKFGDTVQGYPYMVIGKKVFDGYASSYDTAISEAITELSSSSDKYDVVDEIEDGNLDLVSKEEAKSDSNKDGAVISFIFGVIVVIGLFTGYHIIKK